MTSAYTPLGVELMVTGENAGQWGTKTNTNLEVIEQFAGGYTTQAVTDGADTDLPVIDGNTGATLAHRIIELTGSLSAGRNVTIPLDVQNFYIIKNATTGSQIVTFKYITGSGSSVAIANGATVLIYATANDGTNPDIVDTGFSTTAGDVTLTGTQTLTNKTLTSPKIGTSILDTNGAELALLTATGSAVNEFTIANAAAGNGPTLSSTGSSDSNIDINITPKGTGVVDVQGTLLADKGYIAETVLTDQATVTWNMLTESVCKLTLGANRILAAPTNGSNGQFASILIIQDGTGSRTVTWNAEYEFTTDVAPTLTATANLGDLFTFRYNGAKWLEVGRNLALTLS